MRPHTGIFWTNRLDNTAMGFAYFPHTEEDIKAMLGRVGLTDLDGLYSDISPEFIRKDEFDIPEAMSEQEIRRRFSEIASCNIPL